jgi:hypothetical protein
MKSIAYVSCDMENHYEDNSFISRLTDRFKISLLGESFIKELDLKILDIKFPFNINRQSYYNNMKIVRKKIKNRRASLTPKVYRELDYNFLNDFQKKLIAFGIVKSSKLILRKKEKSIRDSCIVIYDAEDKINFDIICSMAKEAKYIILLSRELDGLTVIAEYIIANFGVTPIITSDFNYAIKSADFIITSRNMELDTKAVIWYLNNIFVPEKKDNIILNDITFKVPWAMKETDMSPELLGAILCQMEEKDINESLKYNGVILDKIKFNNEILNL